MAEIPGARVARDETIPTTWKVSKLVIVDRLIALGKANDALTVLAANPILKLRWDATTMVSNDNAEAIGLLRSIGLDPAEILAP